jgi:hypothetical protein
MVVADHHEVIDCHEPVPAACCRNGMEGPGRCSGTSASGCVTGVTRRERRRNDVMR